MSREKRESEDYWMGVRDALRMIDSFVRWSKRNKDRAKPLEQFIADGLIASAKRCKSCLSRELGVTFIEDEDEQEIDVEGPVLSDEVPIQFDEPTQESDFQYEETPLSDAMGYRSPTEPSEVTIDESDIESAPEIIDELETPVIPEDGITIDEFTPSSDSLEEIELGPEPRDFSKEFEVAEPEPLIIEPELPEPEIPPELEMPPLEEEVESEFEDTPPAPPTESSFTWREYEEAMTPEDEDQLEDPSTIPEIDGPPSQWKPLDESVEDLELEVEDEEDELDFEGESPPSPPPPESDESEEERRRRARRLFFGT